MIRNASVTALTLVGSQLAAAIVMTSVSANTVAAGSSSLKVLWSTPISARRNPTTDLDQGKGLTLVSGSMLPDGRVAFLGDEWHGQKGSYPVLLPDVTHRGVENGQLQLKGAEFPVARLTGRLIGDDATDRRLYLLTLTVGTAGQIWVGGLTNRSDDLSRWGHSDAYVARINESGKPRWESVYGRGHALVANIAPMPSGDLIVAGRDGPQGWIARLDKDGRQLWDLHIGNDKGIGVAALPDNRTFVAGFESTGSGLARDYRDDVIAWVIDESGKPLTRTRVRYGINRFVNSDFGYLSVAASRHAAYIMSSWSDSKPIEISKLAMNGTLLWSTRLPDTQDCLSHLAISPRGDALTACAGNRWIHLYQLDGSSGAYRETLLPLPKCQIDLAKPRRPAELFLFDGREGLTLGGSRPGWDAGANCTWVGRLAATI